MEIRAQPTSVYISQGTNPRKVRELPGSLCVQCFELNVGVQYNHTALRMLPLESMGSGVVLIAAWDRVNRSQILRLV
jgi:hypothetical protein